MRIDILTLFPEMFQPVLHSSMLGRAIEKKLLQVETWDIRAFAKGKHRQVDDAPFGGGAGMVMKPEPIYDAVQHVHNEHGRGRNIYLSPQGKPLNNALAQELAQENQLLLLCGHYEGVDQRVLDACFPEEISIGDYVLTGGELPAMVLIDVLARYIPGVLGSERSTAEESFAAEGMLEYPQYTRPRVFMDKDVPEVLLNGNHAHIAQWRREQAKRQTENKRPDLLCNAGKREIINDK